MQRVSIGYQGKPLRRNLRCWFNSDRRIVQGDLREDGSCCEDLDGGSLKKFSSRQTKLRISKASSRFPTEKTFVLETTALLCNAVSIRDLLMGSPEAILNCC